MAPARSSEGNRGERRPTLLLAEDDAELRLLFASALRDDGWEVIEVATGQELLDVLGFSEPTRMLRSRAFASPDVVVSDIQMPGLSGLQVLAGLQQTDWSVPVILLAAFADEATRSAGHRLGAAAVLDKPLDVTELCTVVRRALYF